MLVGVLLIPIIPINALLIYC